ncbi:hypothetical protein DM860_010311 [Cuscuta australis]|uniref:VQ domain-containing protein n=1 Tax=Cuscuta australis TaxID=267555 RepID=A0A328D6T8_9ASTE|nr:hypothetical protein DM860_010311 [Cuscuta australis]
MNHHLIQFQNGHDPNNVVKINPTNDDDDDNNNVNNPALKINRNSHSIKKSPPSSLSSSPIMSGVAVAAMPVTAVRPHQPRHPVIIYTHSPKVIHTHPKDFKALVQKLTGLAAERRSSRPAPPPPPQPKPEPFDPYVHCNGEIVVAGRGGASINDDYDATSVVTDEREGSSSVGPSTYGKYVDSLALMRNSISASSSSLESMKDLPHF